MYCSGCYKFSYCDHPCSQYLDYLSIISECLNGHPIGEDPCPCANKGQFDCPIYGAEKDAYTEHQHMLDYDHIGGIKEE